MKFEFEGRIFTISFRRERRLVPNWTSGKVWAEGGRPLTKHPVTTAIIEVQTGEKLVEGLEGPKVVPIFEPFISANAGCWVEDKFDVEKGRLQALRRLTPHIPQGMRGPLWAAYTERKERAHSKKDVNHAA